MKLFQALTTVYLIGLVIYLILRVAFGDRFWWLALLNNFVPYYFLPAFGLLPIMLLVRDKMMALRLAPFIVIALAWFGPYFIPKTTAQSAGKTLKILTYNLWGDNNQLDEVAAWIRTTDADVVLFQEAHPPTDTAKGMLGLIDLYPHQAIQSTDPRHWERASISKHPILSIENLTSLGAQRLTLDVNGTTIAVYNIHFHVPMRGKSHFRLPINHPYLNSMLRYSDENRNQQIAAFLELIETETLPYIVAGDFNMSDQTTIYPQVAAKMNDTFRDIGVGFGASWPVVFTGIPPLVRIDYIWHSDHFRPLSVRQGPDIGSDHLPLYATFDLQD